MSLYRCLIVCYRARLHADTVSQYSGIPPSAKHLHVLCELRHLHTLNSLPPRQGGYQLRGSCTKKNAGSAVYLNYEGMKPMKPMCSATFFGPALRMMRMRLRPRRQISAAPGSTPGKSYRVIAPAPLAENSVHLHKEGLLLRLADTCLLRRKFQHGSTSLGSVSRTQTFLATLTRTISTVIDIVHSGTAKIPQSSVIIISRNVRLCKPILQFQRYNLGGRQLRLTETSVSG